MTSELKGLVLAGGIGSRLRPLTATGAKQLVPVANKPVLFYALEQLVAAGIREIGIITGDTAAQVRAAVGSGEAFGAEITYLPQSAPLGLAHAIVTAQSWLGDARFCMFLGDNFLRRGIAPYAENFRSQPSSSANILLKRVADPSAFGVAHLDEEGRVQRLVEKPTDSTSNLAVVGVYFFGPEIHAITSTLQPSARGELEITDAIQGLIAGGYRVDSTVIDDDWIDTGKKDDLLEANRIVLMSVSRHIQGEIDSESTIVGDVVIDPGARIIASTIRGPVIIGSGTVIERAYVGPFTAIGKDCHLIDSEIEHSIVLERSTIRGITARIADSLIGRDVVIEGSHRTPHAIRLMLGDHSSVGIS